MTGPVKIVNYERARLVQLIDQAEQEARRWEQATTLLAEQAGAQTVEEAAAQDALRAAEGRLSLIRSETLAPILAEAAADGRNYLAAATRELDAWMAARDAGRFAKRSTDRKYALASPEKSGVRERLVNRWGSVPEPDRWGQRTRDSLQPWVERVAALAAEASSELVAAMRVTDLARAKLRHIQSRHQRETKDLNIAVYGRRDGTSLRRTREPGSAQGRA